MEVGGDESYSTVVGKAFEEESQQFVTIAHVTAVSFQ